MEKETVVLLLQKHLSGSLTEAEKSELASFINRKQNKELVTTSLEELLLQHKRIIQFDEKRFMPLLGGVLKADSINDEEETISDPGTRKTRGFFGKKTLLLLFILVLAGAVGAYYYYFRPLLAGSSRTSNILVVPADVIPGGNKALLTLSDGSTIVLDSAITKTVTQQGDVKVTKNGHGELQYISSPKSGSPVLFNTVTTPRGGQYQLILSDGSRVKLNAFSSITYPVMFSEKERNVTITGEAYFEVAQNDKTPLKIKVYDMEVEVLGTEFNINAYTDEPTIKTTAIKGNIKLTGNELTLSVRPSQQGQFDKHGNFSLAKNIDTNEVIAWKNGMFQFNNAEVKTSMRQIARWYDVDVAYEKGALKDQEVFGEVDRSANLIEVIDILQKSKINCRIDQRTLTVRP